jgi:hypothetical protein
MMAGVLPVTPRLAHHGRVAVDAGPLIEHVDGPAPRRAHQFHLAISRNASICNSLSATIR